MERNPTKLLNDRKPEPFQKPIMKDQSENKPGDEKSTKPAEFEKSFRENSGLKESLRRRSMRELPSVSLTQRRASVLDERPQRIQEESKEAFEASPLPLAQEESFGAQRPNQREPSVFVFPDRRRKSSFFGMALGLIGSKKQAAPQTAPQRTAPIKRKGIFRRGKTLMLEALEGDINVLSFFSSNQRKKSEEIKSSSSNLRNKTRKQWKLSMAPNNKFRVLWTGYILLYDYSFIAVCQPNWIQPFSFSFCTNFLHAAFLHYVFICCIVS